MYIGINESAYEKKMADYIISKALNQSKYKEVIKENWRYYNNDIRKDKFKYLTEVTDAKNDKTFSYPTKFRAINILRRPFNYLISKQSRRDIRLSVVTIDKDSVKEKYRNNIIEVTKMIDDQVNSIYLSIENQYNDILNKKREITQMLKSQPQNQEEAEQLQQVKMMESQIMLRLDVVADKLKREMKFYYKKVEEASKNKKYNYKDLREQLAQKSLFYLKRILNIQQESLFAFIDKIVSGHDIFYVDYIKGDKYPVFKHVNSLKIFYDMDGSNKWIEEGKWVAIKEKMSISQIKEEFDLSKEQLEYLQEKDDFNSGAHIHSFPGKAIFDERNLSTSYMDSVDDYMQQSGIEVYRLFWKKQRKVGFTERDTDKGVFYNVLKEKDFGKKLKKDYKKHFRYVTDVYQCIVIAGMFYTNYGKKSMQVRSIDRPSISNLPVYGRKYDYFTDKPYSLVEACKPIQDLYHVINIKEEFLIALAGVKGFIMDDSQRPSGMSRTEWHYYRRIGQGWIQTMKDGRQSPYNQFQSYDDSVSQSVGYLENIKESLILEVQRNTGITDKTMGEVTPTDQVKTTQSSIRQTELITELFYYEHDKIEARAITALINIDCKLMLKNGDYRDYIDPEMGQVIFKIPENYMHLADYYTFLEDNIYEDRVKEDLRMWALRQGERGALEFSQVLDLYSNRSSLQELKKKFENYAEKAQEIRSKQALDEIEAQKQIEAEKINLKGNIDREIASIKADIEKQKNEIDQARLQSDNQFREIDTILKKNEIEIDRDLKIMEITSENEIENKYLQEQKRQTDIDAMIASMNMDVQEKLKKIDINNTKQKEHISDR